jgi:hypothetical protein
MRENISKKSQVQISTSPNNSIFSYPQTSPAHVNDNFSLWKFEPQFLSELYHLASKASVNPNTGRKRIMFTVTNQGLVHFAKNWICSLRLLKKNRYRILNCCYRSRKLP